MNSLIALFFNLLWLLSSLPGRFAFLIALHFPKQTQQRLLQRIIRRNRNAMALKGKTFNQLEIQDYEELLPYIEKIKKGERSVLTTEQPLLLEPTSGSATGTKLIPYTHSLKKEFRRAIAPWIAGMFLKWPQLLLGCHYWCITPATSEKQKSAVPIGFDTDAAYLGRMQRFIAKHIFAAPADIAKCADYKSTEYITLVFLINRPDLRLISVWHPSLLTLMLKTLEQRYEEILQTLATGILPDDIKSPIPLKQNPLRASQLSEVGYVPDRIWQHLKLISCWGGEACHPWIEQLSDIFPNTIIQPKGLIATEGITTIPLGAQPDITAIRSHYYEFECQNTKQLHPLWEIKKGNIYHLILTTGGGLYRYKTRDLVEVTGFIHKTPCLKFITRNNTISDLVGEKISQAQAEEICRRLPCRHRFAMIAPEKSGNQFRYVLYVDTGDEVQLDEFFESELCGNYHYRHARNTKQLNRSTVRFIENCEQKVHNYLTSTGMQAGNIKTPALRTEIFRNEILI